jgi:hypothetical protein
MASFMQGVSRGEAGTPAEPGPPSQH